MATENASREAGAASPASPPRENLIRATTGIEVRATGDGMPTLTGHFAVWNTWTEIRSAYEGNFMERFAPGSMTKTLSESKPKVLFQHGRDAVVGDKPLGTITRLEPDTTGAFYEVQLLDTTYNRDLIPGLQAGLYGASHRFSVVLEDVNQRPKKSDYNPRGLPERTVNEARVMEFGPVTFGAYPTATAGIRSMTDEYLLATLALDKELPKRTGISLTGIRNPFEHRADVSDISCLTSMVSIGACYLADQDETDDAADIAAMTGVLHVLTGLLDSEIDEPAETDLPDTGMNSAPAEGDTRDNLEPEPSEATTPTPEPEPSEATTHSWRDLLWLTPTP